MRSIAGCAALLCGCGRIGFDPTGGTDGASCTLSAWSPPVEIRELSSTSDDWEPTLSADGVVVFGSNRSGQLQLYQAKRVSETTFGPPTAIAALTSGMTEYGAAWATNDQLYFNRGMSTIQLFTATFTAGAFVNPAPVSELATAEVDAPAISADGLEMFYDTNYELRRALRASSTEPWAPAGVVAELFAGRAAYPTLSADRLTIYFENDQTVAQGAIYVATRPSIDAPFAAATRVDELSGTGGTSDPDLSPDGRMMIFSAQRSTGTGGWDLYLSTRSCL